MAGLILAQLHRADFSPKKERSAALTGFEELQRCHTNLGYTGRSSSETAKILPGLLKEELTANCMHMALDEQ